jgi:AGCS family alanine or glycine:cation symporter
MTCVTKFFQITHFGYWMKQTIGSIFRKDISGHTDAKGEVSQFQALCTALAATVGVGNISGVAGAILVGGPGAIVWMWIAAFVGMMTNFSENVLGIYFRRRNSAGEWAGGSMYFLQDGLGSKKGCKGIGRVLAVLFSLFAVFASFGIGNAGQVSNIAANLNSTFNIPKPVIGVALMIIVALVIIGGIKRIGAVTEKIIPFMVVFYILGTLIIIGMNAGNIIPAFAAIFRSMFGIKSVAGGFGGYAFAQVITMGFKRGVFSNEAGLGSSVMVHSASNVKEPVMQGMWGIFEVFADTMIVCTLTALTILTSGYVDLETGVVNAANKDVLVSEVFTGTFGTFGGIFIAIAIFLFALSTVLGWSYYGTKAWEYLFGTKSTVGYKIVFVLFIMLGATMELDLAWDISDTFNGLMAIPNLIGVITLSPLVYKITKNYIDRVLGGKDIEPMLSFHDDIQQEHAEYIKNN